MMMERQARNRSGGILPAILISVVPAEHHTGKMRTLRMHSSFCSAGRQAGCP